MKIKAILPKSKFKSKLPKNKINEEKILSNVILGCFTRLKCNQGLVRTELQPNQKQKPKSFCLFLKNGIQSFKQQTLSKLAKR